MPSDTAAAPVSDASATGFSQSLKLLADIGQDFAASLDIDDTLRRALSRIAGNLGAEAASLFLLEDDGATLVCRACYGPVNISGMRMPATQGIVGRSLRDNACKMVRDVLTDPDFSSSVDDDTGFRTRSLLCAPMSVQDRHLGAIELINKRDGDGLFSAHDRNALQVLASSAAMAIINARLTAELIEQERVRRELELAAEIQRNQLPRSRDDGFPVCGINVPARGVSGDFFDHFALADGRIAFNVGDVSGKGINAALLMARASGLYRCLGKTITNPGALFATINRELCETGTRGMFVTMVGGVYDPASGVLEFANAGHEPPLLRAAGGGYLAFAAEQPPLGIFADVIEGDYPVRRVRLDGGSFYVFTDGVTEGRVGGAMLGVDGVRGLFDEFHALSAAKRLDTLVARLTQSGRSLHDDVTVLAVEEPRGRAHGRR